jgi:two-component system response regulator RegA
MSTRILVVDDDATFVDVVRRGLERRGYEVATAADGAAACAVARQFEPDRVLLDLKLGEDNGLRVLRELLAICPDARIVLGTGYASIATAVDALRRGAWHYLAKPFDLDTLLRAFEEAPESAAPAPVREEPPALRRLAWEHIQRVLAEYDGNVSLAARALGIHRRTLQRRLAKRPVRD